MLHCSYVVPSHLPHRWFPSWDILSSTGPQFITNLYTSYHFTGRSNNIHILDTISFGKESVCRSGYVSGDTRATGFFQHVEGDSWIKDDKKMTTWMVWRQALFCNSLFSIVLFVFVPWQIYELLREASWRGRTGSELPTTNPRKSGTDERLPRPVHPFFGIGGSISSRLQSALICLAVSFASQSLHIMDK